MDIKVRHVEDVTILEVAGSLDISNAHKMRQAVLETISAEPTQVIINLHDLCSVDSSGLAALVQGLKRAREQQGNLCLCSLQPPVRMILELTRFDKVFDIFISEEDAVLASIRPYRPRTSIHF
jgi:anti-sigma B factor antagonist